MGTWGTGLFSDDTACDVRDEYIDLVKDGMSDAEATQQFLDSWAAGLNIPGEREVIWIALAATQCRLGRLDPAVAERAVEAIDGGVDLDLWLEAGSKMVARRRAVLQRTRRQLTGPQPRRRTFRLPTTTLTPGDILAYQTRDADFLLLRVVRVRHGIPIVILLDYLGPQIPALDAVAALPEFLWPMPKNSIRYSVPIDMHRKNGVDYARAGYQLIGNLGDRPGDSAAEATADSCNWSDYLPDHRVASRLLESTGVIPPIR